MVTEQEVLSVLQGMVDPDTGAKISDIGKLSVTVNKGDVGIILQVPERLGAPWEREFKRRCESIIKSKIPGVVSVTLVTSIVRVPKPAPKADIQGVNNVVLVASGKGGVGKSTVATFIALTLANKGYAVSLVDADIYGPSIPQLLGTKSMAAVDDVGMIIPVEAYGVKSISMGNIVEDNEKAVVWRGPMLAKAINKLITGTKWGTSDYMIIDTPPGTGDVHISITHGYKLTGAVVVLTPHDLSMTQAMKTCDMLHSLGVGLLGVVENMSYFLDRATGIKTSIFGEGGGLEIARRTGSTLLGEVGIYPKMSVSSFADSFNAADGELQRAYEKITSNMLDSIRNAST
ncbi:Mrp/NBP35 family ATP-binding protein [Candidatus Anaplasma sp. TIGMIC]|uniref:Mrp/NBP35 family ATP-binding protein n=1 Tax=Candidatus Anaplasma sp. TIGMIC TaxID=3020713 RepID=UPI00232CDEFA|nr:Mrp/NBP35 family ATP-binding protein [Candidatus Anaplasma sp. TIGMIC]MDB1135535.1 Mrp/NBP35 family ATP-binding protein [Candidatus Anaplasma sp. TIGMIC]